MAEGSELVVLQMDSQKYVESQTLQANAVEFMKQFTERSTVSHRNGGESAVTELDNGKVRSVQLEWKNVIYSLSLGRRSSRIDKTILDQLSGRIEAGHLLAIMGPSGCGKTSLINALAGRLPKGGQLTGQILVNGRSRGAGFLGTTAYVMQDDVLFHTLTVYETFMFASELQLPTSVPKEDKQAMVMKIILELGLLKVKDTYIGNAMLRGVSGGERKRCNIGFQMISNPSLIFLDEPTSGLDAFQAQSVMESLWTLAKNGRTVVSTIHQPRSSIYAMFDVLLLLSEGKQIYFGPAKDAPEYFEKCGFPFPPKFNPADFFLDVISLDQRSKDAELASRQRILLLADSFEKQQEEYLRRSFSMEKQKQQYVAELDVSTGSSFKTNVFHQYTTLLKRSFLQVTRDKFVMVLTFVQNIVIAILLGLIYMDMGDDQESIQNRRGLLFFITINASFGNMFGVLNTFPTEKGVINRERSSKMYRVLPYYLAKWTAELPVRLLVSLLYSSIVYWMSGLNSSADRFFIFLGILILHSLVAYAMGIAISALAKTEKVALAIAPTMTVILILFGGFLINTESLPPGAQWVRNISHLYWAFRGFAVNEFRGETYACDPNLPICQDGDDVLESLSFGDAEVWQSVVALLIIFMVWNIIGYISLRFSKTKFQAISQDKKAN